MEILNANGNQILGEWQKCQKKSYVIEAKKVSEDSEIFNPLERATVQVKKGEILLKGLLGEIWVIEESKFLARYTDEEGKSLSNVVKEDSFDWMKVATKPDDEVYFALRIPKEKECAIFGMKTDKKEDAKFTNNRGEFFRTMFEINSKNSISTHGEGDCLICTSKDDGTPDFSDVWVVDGFVFERTYKLV